MRGNGAVDPEHLATKAEAYLAGRRAGLIEANEQRYANGHANGGFANRANRSGFSPISGDDGRTPLTLRDFHEIDFDPSSETWLIEDLLLPQQVSLVHGPHNSGKTFMALDLCLSLAAGPGSWMGHKIREPGQVVYLASEAGKGTDKRIAAWKQEHGYRRGDRLPFSVISEPVNLCDLEAGDCQRIVTAVNSHLAGKPLALLIIETVNSVLAGGNENSSEDMGALLTLVQQLRDELHCHVMLIHHPNKNGPGSRGHYSLPCAVDTEFAIDQDEESRVTTVKMTKQREAEKANTFAFQLRQVVLGYNRDGKAVTSCVVDEADPPDETKSKAEGGKGKGKRNPEAALDGAALGALHALRHALDKGGKPAHETNARGKTSDLTTAVDIDLWFRYFKEIDRGGGRDLNDKQWADRFYKLKDRLYKSGLVRSNGGYAWEPPSNA
jgi:hypothetical protein